MTSERDHDREAGLVRIPGGEVQLDGTLTLPPKPLGLVLFAHGSGSSRFSPRNRFVADALQCVGLGTLLMDLLTQQEEAIDERTAHLRFDIRLLAERLVHATDWLSTNETTRRLPLGYFGASTGGGAALVAAAERRGVVGAIVSRGGRPDLAAAALSRVLAPTLLIVGGWDDAVVELNQHALQQMPAGVAHLEIVPRATHLFEEPGALERVAQLAGDWFVRHLGQLGQARSSAAPTADKWRDESSLAGRRYDGQWHVDTG